MAPPRLSTRPRFSRDHPLRSRPRHSLAVGTPDNEGQVEFRSTGTLAAGTYYVAISNFNTSNNQSDANPQENYQSDSLLDFPDAVANSSTTTALAVSFSVSDGTTTQLVTATKATPSKSSGRRSR